MIEKQESKDLVQGEFKKEEPDFDDLSEVKSLFFALRRYSVELTVGVFGVSMLYVFAYMSSSNLPLSLLSINSGIKMTVLFSLLLIIVFIFVIAVTAIGVFYGCYVYRIAHRIGCDKSKRSLVIWLFAFSMVFHSASLAFSFSILNTNYEGVGNYIAIGALIVFVFIIPPYFCRFIYFSMGVGEFYNFWIYFTIFCYMSVWDSFAISIFSGHGGLGASCGLCCFFSIAMTAILFEFPCCLLAFAFSNIKIGTGKGVVFVLSLVCFALLWLALFFPVGSWLVQRVLRLSSAGTAGCSVIMWSGHLPDGLKVLDDAKAREHRIVGAGHSIPVYIENDLGDSYVVTVKGVSKRQFYFLPKSLVSGMEDCSESKKEN